MSGSVGPSGKSRFEHAVIELLVRALAVIELLVKVLSAWQIVNPVEAPDKEAESGPKMVSPPRRRRRRKPGRRGPERHNADYWLRRLIKEERKSVLREGGTELEANQKVEEIKRLSSQQLAAMVNKKFKIRRDGRTYRRNSSLYKKWKSQRAASTPLPRGGRDRGTSGGSEQDILGKAEIDAGNLSLSGPRRRRTKANRGMADLYSDARADEFLRQNGVDPRDMPAE